MIFKIHSPACIRLAAAHLRAQLKLLGYHVVLVDDIDVKDHSLYIIYAACSVKHLPKNYIVYQTEVSTSSWFTPKYLNLISNAVCVWEYSEANVSRYKSLNSRISIVTPGISEIKTPVKDGGVLFYGWINGCRRREVALRKLSRQMKINIITNITGEEMWYLLSRAQVVVNIHYYEKAPLEVFRINEALSFNCHVVSETSASGDDKYKQLIHFADTDKMAPVIKELMEKPFKAKKKVLNNLQEIRSALVSLKTYYAARHK